MKKFIKFMMIVLITGSVLSPRLSYAGTEKIAEWYQEHIRPIMLLLGKKENYAEREQSKRKEAQEQQQANLDYQNSYDARRIERLSSLGLNSEKDLIDFDISQLPSQMQENVRLSNMLVEEAAGERCPEAEKFDAYKEVKYHDEFLTRFGNLVKDDIAPLAYDLPYYETYNFTDKDKIDAVFDNELKFTEFLNTKTGEIEKSKVFSDRYLFSRFDMRLYKGGDGPSAYGRTFNDYNAGYRTAPHSGARKVKAFHKWYLPRGIKSNGARYNYDSALETLKLLDPVKAKNFEGYKKEWEFGKRQEKEPYFHDEPLSHNPVGMYSRYKIAESKYHWKALNYSKIREEIIAKSAKEENLSTLDLEIGENENKNNAISIEESIWDKINYLTGLKEKPKESDPVIVYHTVDVTPAKRKKVLRTKEIWKREGMKGNFYPYVGESAHYREWLVSKEGKKTIKEYEKKIQNGEKVDYILWDSVKITGIKRTKKTLSLRESDWIGIDENSLPAGIRDEVASSRIHAGYTQAKAKNSRDPGRFYKGRKVQYYNPTTDEVVYLYKNAEEAIKYDFYKEAKYHSRMVDVFRNFTTDEDTIEECGNYLYENAFWGTFHYTDKERIDESFESSLNYVTEETWERWKRKK